MSININGNFIRDINEEDRINYLLDVVFECDYILGRIDCITNNGDAFVTICSPKNVKEKYILDGKKWSVYFNLKNVKEELKNKLKMGDFIYFKPAINKIKPEQIIQIRTNTIKKVENYEKFLEDLNIEKKDIVLKGEIAIEELNNFDKNQFKLWATEKFYNAFKDMYSDLIEDVISKQSELIELDYEKMAKEEEIKQEYAKLQLEKQEIDRYVEFHKKEIDSKKLELNSQKEELKRLEEKLSFFGFIKLTNKEKIMENIVEYNNYTYNEIFEYVKSYIRNNEKLIYSDDIIRRFLLCMQSDELTILSGPSGTGKTSIVTAFANAIGGEAKIIPVKPNWTDTEDLLGFYNPIEKSYVASPFLDALVDAKENKDKLYLICLDEMNLAHIEYYFAEFLSKLELSKDKKTIELYSKYAYNEILEEIVYEINSMTGNIVVPPVGDVVNWCKKEIENWCNENDKDYVKQLMEIRKRINFIEKYPSEFEISSNVRFIGTMNVDQTTKNISPKVIDRSFVIELLNYNTFDDIDEENIEEQKYIKADSFNFINNVIEEENKEIIDEIMDINEDYLNSLGANFNNRTKKHMQNYISCLSNYDFEIDSKNIISDLVYLKLLPRINVSYKNKNDNKYVSWTNLKSKLEEKCTADIQIKLNKMDKMSEEDNILSFWGVY